MKPILGVRGSSRIGTTRATGRPSRAMMNSSSTRRDKWVFASCMFTIRTTCATLHSLVKSRLVRLVYLSMADSGARLDDPSCADKRQWLSKHVALASGTRAQRGRRAQGVTSPRGPLVDVRLAVESRGRVRHQRLRSIGGADPFCRRALSL